MAVRLTFEGATYQDVRRAVLEWLSDPDEAADAQGGFPDSKADPYKDLAPAWTEDAPRAALRAPTARPELVTPGGRLNPFAAPVGASTAAVADPEPAPHCPDHGVPMRFKPAGRSRTTGNAYAAFWSCPNRDCRRTQDFVART